jgi:hypothetical protein
MEVGWRAEPPECLGWHVAPWASRRFGSGDGLTMHIIREMMKIIVPMM